MTTQTKTTWKKVKLGDVAEIESGGTPSSSKPEYWDNGDICWATLPDLKNKYIFDTQRKITALGLKNSSAKLLPIDSVIFSSRATIGEISITKVETSTNQGSKNFICDPKKIEYEFLYYLLKSKVDEIIGLATGATYKEINKTVFSSIEIDIPNLLTQKQIADVLSAYDDLIENNTKRIKILEEIAQAIYKEWFVFFRFPGHEKAKMVDSKTEFGKIPEGWEVKKVGQLIAKIQRKHKVQRGEYIKEGEFPVIDQGRDFIGGYTANNETVYKDNLPLIVFGDHTRVLKFVDFPFACGADGTQLLSSNSERMPITLFFYALQNVDLSNFAYARHFKFLKEKNVLFPDQQTASAFDSYINPIRGFIRGLLQENIKLRQARDLLLPKLVTGEIEVKL
ncbi:hypothetical protein A3H55_00820 [Candidatus Kuenenbacteria bacterium RIFCSPLOWO2_02_FULL_42_16]|uniref:Type I restriction modification DNA specificity domain-containing protein n=1 Tax=Candidatus Kuenenbacteria bacterium RIFCSPLOWO2_02_FULL_42_16 TaxID=1798564 RepID=A0A1F6FWW5_9BACT|nr:MAG: hypothetical protein A3H55_00820 [Candidatus Kuenenbacteria bacterium RIFCSPLOWO2_02_FULL_42_16]